MYSTKIPLISPEIPPFSEIEHELKEVWDSGILTNHGPVEQSLEERLKSFTSVKFVHTCVNGTEALKVALKSLPFSTGEIITTPFSWISSANAIISSGFTPRFVDIDPETLNIDINAIENAIHKETVGILAVHVFGNPCNIDAISAIAQKYSLATIFDAAHAMGSTYDGKSVFMYGDISTVSFHSTKIVGSGEGGAIFTNKQTISSRAQEFINFGFNPSKTLTKISSNLKFNELAAFMCGKSLALLPQTIKARKRVNDIYRTELDFPGIRFQTLQNGTNYSYFPIIFENEENLCRAMESLKNSSIDSRRYFYPLLNSYSLIIKKSKSETIINSEEISNKILILPSYSALSDQDIERVIKAVSSAHGK